LLTITAAITLSREREKVLDFISCNGSLLLDRSIGRHQPITADHTIRPFAIPEHSDWLKINFLSRWSEPDIAQAWHHRHQPAISANLYLYKVL
jgi:hypothetical protein